MDDKTQAELKAMCVEAGLPTYGNKQQLIERLQADAAASLAETVAEPEAPTAVEPEPTPEPVAAPQPVRAPKVIVTQSTVPTENLPPVNHAAHVQDVLDACRSRFHGLNVRYDSNEEVFMFEGGRQGRVSTTSRQPARCIIGAAESYYNLARGRAKADFGELA